MGPVPVLRNAWRTARASQKLFRMRYPDKIEVRFQIGDAVHWRLPNGAVLNQLEGIVVAINGDAVCVRWNDGREISYGPISRDRDRSLKIGYLPRS
jgi:hypothetical protein